MLAAAPDAQQQTALAHISASNMKANLSFLASDALEGRDTPSKGLEVAGEFISSQFRKAGLEPAAGDSYFQKAQYALVTADPTDFDLIVESGSGETHTTAAHVTKDFDLQTSAALDLKSIAIVKISVGSAVDAPALAGKAALLEMPEREKLVEYAQTLRAVRQAHPAVILLLPRGNQRHAPATQLLPVSATAEASPTVIIRDAAAETSIAAATDATLSVHARAPQKKPVELRNVAGVLRGSAPSLRDTYILVTAHYDHTGVLPPGEGDRINNGANDDGSGTVSVIEIAEALAQMPKHPSRSILFLCFFGEEKGLFGSRYYAAHPLFPLRNTIAQVNLEQLGRTDDPEGPQIASATFTGYDYSDLPATFAAAGPATGIRVYKNEQNSDAFFARSDNQSLADAGIPAHTLAVAFEFPDYHQPGDEWQKIDYENMAKVDRMIALGLLTLANSADVPHWNAANAKTEPYRKAAAAK